MRRYATITSFIALAFIIAGLLGWQFGRPLAGVFSPTATPTKLIVLPTSQPDPMPTPTPDPLEEEYYRAIYDVCVYFGVKEHPSTKGQRLVKEACGNLVDKALKQEWYEKPSPGWEWPVRVRTAEQER